VVYFLLQVVAEWLACSIAAMMLSGNSLRQAVHTHFASVHQTVKLVAAVLRVARVTAGLAERESNYYYFYYYCLLCRSSTTYRQ